MIIEVDLQNRCLVKSKFNTPIGHLEKILCGQFCFDYIYTRKIFQRQLDFVRRIASSN